LTGFLDRNTGHPLQSTPASPVEDPRTGLRARTPTDAGVPSGSDQALVRDDLREYGHPGHRVAHSRGDAEVRADAPRRRVRLISMVGSQRAYRQGADRITVRVEGPSEPQLACA